MKTSPKKRAFALVLVLIIIVLAATMAVFFLASAGQERRGVDLYARGSQVRHLAGMTVNRVMGQISAATKEGTATAPVSWASQPGMVRTFAATGTSAVNFYKLYSWDTGMVTAGGFNPAAAGENPPSGWKNTPAMFSDLNQPINDVYPIVDPRAAGAVEGFSIDSANPAVAGSGSDAPMPVKWLYVLQDGQMVAPTNPSGSTVTVPGASITNPIVGRVAFWTDDETSKVNINTASEGAFWDSPKSAARDEMQFAANPPVKNEFQRTPGHPSMTSLSAVFPELITQNTSDWTQTRWTNPNYRTQLESIYSLTPRVVGGGSQGGTAPIDSYSEDYSIATVPTLPVPITPDSDRLYATADDFWFSPTRAFQPAFSSSSVQVDLFRQRLFFLTASSRAPETTLFETPRVSLWPITWPWPSAHYNLLKDLNTFRGRNYPSGGPSSVSPTSAIEQNPWMTAQERLLAFCATLNILSSAPNRYYFQRQNPDSPTHDWNNIVRNQDLVKYLRRTLEKDEPGFGGSLADRWGADNADWISLNTLDFSRSLINQVTMESIPTKLVVPGNNELGYSFTGLSSRDIWINGNRKSDYKEPNSYTVSPLRATLNGKTYVTQGTYPKLSEVALMFYATQRRLPVPPTPVPASPNPPARAVAPATTENDYYNPFNWQYLINPGPAFGGSANYPVGSQTTQMRAVMLFNFTGLTTGALSGSPFFWVRVVGPGFRVNGGNIGFPSPAGRSVQWTGWAVAGSINPNFWPLFDKNRGVPKIFDNSSSSANRWSLISDPITMDPNAVEFAFEGGPITVEIYAPYSSNLDTDPTADSSQLVATQEIDFSQWNDDLPIPIAPRWNVRDGFPAIPDKPTNRPDPSISGANFATPEARPMTWAYTEIAPNIANPTVTFSPEVIRDSVTVANTRTIPYAYVGTGTGSMGTVLVSPEMENRVRSLNGRNTAVFKAENTGVDLTLATVDTPFMEGVPLITPFDTVISMVPDPSGAGDGDPRLSGSANTFFRRIDSVLTGLQPALVFRTTGTSSSDRVYPRATARAQYHMLGTPGAAGPMSTGYRENQLSFGGAKIPMATAGRLIYVANETVGKLGQRGPNPGIDNFVGGSFSPTNNVNTSWDWTMMPGNRLDGGFLVRPDQDYQSLFTDTSDNTFVGTPYFLRYGSYGAPGSSYFSPNRQVASPVLLGTLPTSMDEGWRTLAFSPNPAAGSSHPGLANPPDHLLLDLFWMPVAEPYPISEQFSTAGKVNLNYAIMPFSYIERKTALHALLKTTWVHSLAENWATDYKSHFHFRQGNPRTRFAVDVDETLADFDDKFAAGDVFKSASQICEMFLVPKNETLSATKASYWNSKRLTADNGREQPYDHLYSRVTTKSNTFTVHWRVQALRKLPSGTAGVWDESKDRMASELRGATMIERFIDPNATDIPDYATDPDAEPLGNFYKWRVLSETFFQP